MAGSHFVVQSAKRALEMTKEEFRKEAPRRGKQATGNNLLRIVSNPLAQPTRLCIGKSSALSRSLVSITELIWAMVEPSKKSM